MFRGDTSTMGFNFIKKLITTIGLIGIMAVSATGAGYTVNGNLWVTGRTNITGTITGDVHVNTPIVLGGSTASGTLNLQSTANATKGKVTFGSSGNTAYDEVNERFGIGTNAPNTGLEVVGGNVEGIRIKSSSNSPYLRWMTGGGATMRNWGIGTNYNDAGNFEIFYSTDNTSAPLTQVLKITSGGNYTFYGNLLTTAIVTAGSIDTGQGVNELYDMNQNVQTTDLVTFDGVNITTLSYIRRTNGLTQGSTNTNVVIYGTAQESAGNDITYQNSATSGDSFLINTSGIYAVSVLFRPANAAVANNMGIYVAGAIVNTFGGTSIRAQKYSSTNNYEYSITWTGYIAANDLIWTMIDDHALTGVVVNAITIARVR